MAKTRVFELAQKLGMGSKEIIEKLDDAGIQVSSHMSVLEDEEIQKFESASAPKVEKVEEERIKPGIIRRRRKEVPASRSEAKPVVEEPAPEAKEAAQEVTPEEPVEPTETPAPVAEEKAPAVEKVKKVQEEAAPPEQEPVAAKEKAPKPATKPEGEKPVAAAPKEKVEKPEKATATRAKVLGRVDLSQLSGARREEAPSRPRREARPAGEKPAPRRGAPAPSGPPGRAGGGRPSPVPVAPDELFPAKEVRGGKKNKKGKAGPAHTEEEGAPRGRRTRREVFEPDRGGRMRKPKKNAKSAKKTEVTVSKAIKRVIRITDTITVGELAKRMGIKANELIGELMRQGSMVTINHPLDFDTAALLAGEYNYEIENVAFDEAAILDQPLAEKEAIESEENRPEDLVSRPPVVTVMGHVDHGKTSLLDAIRAANVTGGEAGGITQHIGAYYVELGGRLISFLDTPGHEAFTAMRARGAKATDIVILVVAADDGVMPQTREAINHAKAGGVPIIVAVNKMDKPEANAERVKQELTEFELIPEEWGGETIFSEVSAKEQLNLDHLLEMILLQAEVMELKANPKKRGKGIIVEARLDKGRGPVATVLVQDGTLHVGDPIVSGVHFGRVRSMVDDRGNRLDVAGPSMPVEVTGLTGVPEAGELLHALEDEKKARDVAQHRQMKMREAELAKTSKISLDQLYAKIQEGDVKELKVVIKGDVQGSVEAVKESLQKLSTDACRLVVIHTGVGGITESDINLASASDAIVLGFNVRPEAKASQLAEQEGVDIRLYNIIYDAVADIKDAMEGLLAPTLREKALGRAEVRDTFSVSRIGTIAGCYILDGKMVRNARARLVRDSVVIWEGKLSSLKRFKDDVKEVAAGYECGLSLENYNDIKVGDIIEDYEMEEIKTKL